MRYIIIFNLDVKRQYIFNLAPWYTCSQKSQNCFVKLFISVQQHASFVNIQYKFETHKVVSPLFPSISARFVIFSKCNGIFLFLTENVRLFWKKPLPVKYGKNMSMNFRLFLHCSWKISKCSCFQTGSSFFFL